MVYLDIILFINGAMDAFLLVFTAHLLRKKIQVRNLLGAVLLGELPIVFIIFGPSWVIAVSRILVPVGMVAVALRTRTILDLAKGLLYFSLLASLSAGIYYALAGWLGLEGTGLALKDLWVLPVIALILTAGCRVWEKIQKTTLFLDNVCYEVELSFENGRQAQIKALLDTGNELRDPLTGTPVMVVEERAVAQALPEGIQRFLLMPWRESANPWTYIWNSEDPCIQKMVFISARGINGQTWLPGIRLGSVKIRQGEKVWEHAVTAALVPHGLNSEGKFVALLHPEHIQKPVGKEEIA